MKRSGVFHSYRCCCAEREPDSSTAFDLPKVTHSYTNSSLKDRYAIITGGARGLGACIAQHYVKAGASVLLCSRTQQALEAVQTPNPRPPPVLLAVDKSRERVNIFNVGADTYAQVKNSVAWITEQLGVKPRITYSGGERGWVGDSPFIFLDCKRIRGLGWRPKLAIREGVIRTLDWLRKNRWVLEKRA